MKTGGPSRLHGAIVIWLRNLRVWRRFFLASAIGDLAEPIIYLLAMGYGIGALIPEVAGTTYINYIAPGLVLSASMFAATFEGTYGTYTRMVPQHTFEGILATPLDLTEIVIGEVLFAATKALVAGLAVLAVVGLLGLMDSAWGLATPVLCILCGIMFGSLAVLVTAISPSYDFFNYYFTLFITPALFFSGIFFPLEGLPTWVEVITWLNPLTHATHASRALFTGGGPMALIPAALGLAVTSLIPLVLAVRAMRRRLIH